MGGKNGENNEDSAYTVYLDSFWIGETEVTNRMYIECVDEGKCEDPDGNKHAKVKTYPNHPAEHVEYTMAQDYCEWVGGRLPTEAEWEKAARGGLQGKKYPWGDEAPTCQAGAFNGAQTWNCSGAYTVEVKTFAPNGYGLYDMAGNVWEWVAESKNSTYEIADADELRSAIQKGLAPLSSWDSYGFRCAWDANTIVQE